MKRNLDDTQEQNKQRKLEGLSHEEKEEELGSLVNDERDGVIVNRSNEDLNEQAMQEPLQQTSVADLNATTSPEIDASATTIVNNAEIPHNLNVPAAANAYNQERIRYPMDIIRHLPLEIKIPIYQFAGHHTEHLHNRFSATGWT
ncbi:hypothetical protein HDU76_007569 [Blyttiomyces sp. JEL0837]|nr:hypothetical protein HDU76_007569 [Blyttiomyces sp. JEL0837]